MLKLCNPTELLVALNFSAPASEIFSFRSSTGVFSPGEHLLVGMLADCTPPAARVLGGAGRKATDVIPEGHGHCAAEKIWILRYPYISIFTGITVHLQLLQYAKCFFFILYFRTILE